jgi:hypothetical protein
MKRAFVLLVILGFAFSPLMASQSMAAPAGHHVVKHHRKHVAKHAARRLTQKHTHNRKLAV